jgi:hypothetical protein
MFQPNQQASGVQVVVIMKSTAHCNAVLFLLCSCLTLHLVIWVNNLFNFGVLELHVCLIRKYAAQGHPNNTTG